MVDTWYFCTPHLAAVWFSHSELTGIWCQKSSRSTQASTAWNYWAHHRSMGHTVSTLLAHQTLRHPKNSCENWWIQELDLKAYLLDKHRFVSPHQMVSNNLARFDVCCQYSLLSPPQFSSRFFVNFRIFGKKFWTNQKLVGTYLHQKVALDRMKTLACKNFSNRSEKNLILRSKVSWNAYSVEII